MMHAASTPHPPEMQLLPVPCSVAQQLRSDPQGSPPVSPPVPASEPPSPVALASFCEDAPGLPEEHASANEAQHAARTAVVVGAKARRIDDHDRVRPTSIVMDPRVIPATLASLMVCSLATSEAGAQEVQVRPFVGWSHASRSVTDAFVGVDAGLRVSPYVAVSVDAAWYAPFDPVEYSVTSSTPVNESRWSSDVDLVVYPLAALTRPDEAPGTIEPYVLGGVGLMVDRPVAVVDPVDRRFGDQALVQLVAGLGARMFVTRRFTLSLDARAAQYFDRREATTVPNGASSLPVTDPHNPANPATWYDPAAHFTSDLQVRLGASFVLGH